MIMDMDDMDLHEEDTDEKAADVIEAIKQATELQEQAHNSPFQAGAIGLGSNTEEIPNNHAIAEVPDKDETVTAQVNSDTAMPKAKSSAL